MRLYGKETGYKINTQRSVAFVYTHHSIAKKGLVRLVPIITKTQVPLNLIKDVKHTNYKTLKKEIEEIQKHGKIYYFMYGWN